MVDNRHNTQGLKLLYLATGITLACFLAIFLGYHPVAMITPVVAISIAISAKLILDSIAINRPSVVSEDDSLICEYAVDDDLRNSPEHYPNFKQYSLYATTPTRKRWAEYEDFVRKKEIGMKVKLVKRDYQATPEDLAEADWLHSNTRI